MGMAEEIRSRLTMQEVAEHYGFQVGRSGFIKCPLHRGDNTASMKLYDGAGGFHCFGCGAHGSVIDFVMQLFNLNFKQAVLRINSDFHLGLTSSKPDRSTYSRILEARREEIRRKEQAEENFRCAAHELHYWKDVRNTSQSGKGIRRTITRYMSRPSSASRILNTGLTTLLRREAKSIGRDPRLYTGRLLDNHKAV